MALTRPSKLISSDISGSFNKSAVSASFAQSSAVTASLRSHVLTSALSGSTTIISGSVKSTGSFGSIYTDKNVNASAFVGDGSSLTGIDIPTAAAISGSFISKADKSAISGSIVGGVSGSALSTGSFGRVEVASTGSFGRVEVAGDLSVSSTLHLGAFEARLTSTQSVNHNVTTTVDFNGDGEEVIDVDSYWDNANNRYQPTVAGKYFLCAETSINLDEGEQAILFIREDGTTNLTYHVVCGGGADNDVTLQTSCIADADTSNWFEMAVYQIEGAAQNLLVSNRTRFHGFRVA